MDCGMPDETGAARGALRIAMPRAWLKDRQAVGLTRGAPALWNIRVLFHRAGLRQKLKALDADYGEMTDDRSA